MQHIIDQIRKKLESGPDPAVKRFLESFKAYLQAGCKQISGISWKHAKLFKAALHTEDPVAHVEASARGPGRPMAAAIHEKVVPLFLAGVSILNIAKITGHGYHRIGDVIRSLGLERPLNPAHRSNIHFVDIRNIIVCPSLCAVKFCSDHLRKLEPNWKTTPQSLALSATTEMMLFQDALTNAAKICRGADKNTKFADSFLMQAISDTKNSDVYSFWIISKNRKISKDLEIILSDNNTIEVDELEFFKYIQMILCHPQVSNLGIGFFPSIPLINDKIMSQEAQSFVAVSISEDDFKIALEKRHQEDKKLRKQSLSIAGERYEQHKPIKRISRTVHSFYTQVHTRVFGNKSIQFTRIRPTYDHDFHWDIYNKNECKLPKSIILRDTIDTIKCFSSCSTNPEDKILIWLPEMADAIVNSAPKSSLISSSRQHIFLVFLKLINSLVNRDRAHVMRMVYSEALTAYELKEPINRLSKNDFPRRRLAAMLIISQINADTLFSKLEQTFAEYNDTILVKLKGFINGHLESKKHLIIAEYYKNQSAQDSNRANFLFRKARISISKNCNNFLRIYIECIMNIWCSGLSEMLENDVARIFEMRCLSVLKQVFPSQQILIPEKDLARLQSLAQTHLVDQWPVLVLSLEIFEKQVLEYMLGFPSKNKTTNLDVVPATAAHSQHDNLETALAVLFEDRLSPEAGKFPNEKWWITWFKLVDIDGVAHIKDWIGYSEIFHRKDNLSSMFVELMDSTTKADKRKCQKRIDAEFERLRKMLKS